MLAKKPRYVSVHDVLGRVSSQPKQPGTILKQCMSAFFGQLIVCLLSTIHHMWRRSVGVSCISGCKGRSMHLARETLLGRVVWAAF